MNRADATEILDRLHEAQNDFYGGGEPTELEQILDPTLTWTVPGSSPIAGTYRGLAEVLAYFRRRRELATGTFRMTRRDVLVGEGSRIVALTDGAAVIAGAERSWSTVGLYELDGDRIAACRLIPFDQAEFDAIWSGAAG
jgi:hypothetical protein